MFSRKYKITVDISLQTSYNLNEIEIHYQIEVAAGYMKLMDGALQQ